MGLITYTILLLSSVLLLYAAKQVSEEDEVLDFDAVTLFNEKIRLMRLFPEYHLSASEELISSYDLISALAKRPNTLRTGLSPELTRSTCRAWDSCILRCGDPTLGAPYRCSCDHDCDLYKDCCVDYKHYCGSSTFVSRKTSDSSRKSQEKNHTYTRQPPWDSSFVSNFNPNYKQENAAFDNSSTNLTLRLSCRPLIGAQYYGVYMLDGKVLEPKRLCALHQPPWCDPNYLSLYWNLAPSLSMLMNFGPEGWHNNDLLYSSMYHNPNLCPSVWEIWDPFAHRCRPIECNKEYVLENGECVWDGEGPEPPDTNDFLGYKSLAANISIIGSVLLTEENKNQALQFLRTGLQNTLSTKLRILSSRIYNISVRGLDVNLKRSFQDVLPDPSTDDFKPEDLYLWTPTEKGFPVSVNFTLLQKEENNTDLSIDEVLSVLNEAMTLSAVLYTDKGVPFKITSIEQTLSREEITFFEDWCTLKGGDVVHHWNEAFEVKLVVKNYTDEVKMEMVARIKDTNATYEEGHFVANLLYQSSDEKAVAANVSGILIVCENRPNIEDPSCVRMQLDESEYEIENGTLVYTGKMKGVAKTYNRSEYEFKENGLPVVCINYDEAAAASYLSIEPTTLEKVASILTFCLVIVSLFCLLATILTYSIFEELRNLPGCCLIHLCACMFAFYLIFITGVRPPVEENKVGCAVVAILLHLSVLSLFTWSTVMSFDLYATFTTFQTVARTRRKYLWRYTVLGYGVPIAIVFVSVMLDFHSDVKIDYGENVCWIGNPETSMYLFAIPIFIATLCSIIFYVLTIRGIRRSESSTSSLRRQERSRFAVYVRMSSIQCFAWVLGFVAVFFHFSNVASKIFEFGFIILSSLQGLYIFLAFVANSRTYVLYKSLFDDRPKTKGFGFDPSSFSGRIINTKRPVQKTGSSQRIELDQNRNAASRTISNETTISVISNSTAC